ncbi:MAG: glycosyltransferase family 2 protein [Candidatus Hydrogenedentes bacterium]|nr:glycosyltransferase family 2 protein [Candidatus Hydrogenedentota bacterium]
MRPPLVYVIVINWNGREHLDACFSSLLASTCENVVFLLVDNASTDGSAGYIREHFGNDPRVEILSLSSNLGWSGGNNAGIRLALKAAADYIFLLNNDTATESGALSAMLAAMETDSSLGALAPRMVLFDQPELLNSVGLNLSVIGAAWDRGIGRLDGPRWHEPIPVVGVCGGALFLRAALLERTGLLPEDFEIYLDDLDLCLRVWTAGYTIRSCPGAVIRHKFSATMGQGARARHKYYLNTRNRFRIVQRHFPMALRVRAFPLLLLGELRAMGRAVLSGEVWRVPAHIKAWRSALAYLPEARRFRRTRQAAGTAPCWRLVLDSPLFCPRIVFPEQGWYPPVTVRGLRLRPMARCATLALGPGPLQVCLVNCYPAQGLARLSLYSEDRCLATLETADAAELHMDFSGGLLTFRTESSFYLEDTGAAHDAGAWLQVTRDGIHLV